MIFIIFDPSSAPFDSVVPDRKTNMFIELAGINLVEIDTKMFEIGQKMQKCKISIYLWGLNPYQYGVYGNRYTLFDAAIL